MGTVAAQQMPALTPEELFQFDTFGWLHVPAVFTPEEVALMRKLASDWLATAEALLLSSSAGSDASNSQQLPPPLEPYTGPLGNSTGADEPGARVIKGIYHTQYGHRLFERCACDTRILRVVRSLQEGNPCHVNQNLMEIRSDTDERITFHGNLDPGDRFYEVRGDSNGVELNTPGGSSAGRYCFSSLVNVSVSLCDVPAGQGFVSVPGSHRRGFSPPKIIDLSATVGQTVRAGDALIFCEALWHSATPWKCAANSRLTVFSRFWAHCSEARWRSYNPEQRLPYESQLGDDLQELQRCPCSTTSHHRRKNSSAPTLAPASPSTSATRSRSMAVGRLTRMTLPLRGLCARESPAAPVSILVTESAGIRRYKFPVLCQLPRAGSRGTQQRLRIVDNASHSEIPAQTNNVKPLAFGDTGTLQRLNVYFHCSLEPFETRTFTADWVETTTMFSPPRLELNGMHLMVEESIQHGSFIVKNAEAIHWRIPIYLRRGIGSVFVPPVEYVRQERQHLDASAVELTYSDGTTRLFAPTTKGTILTPGPFMVQIRYTDTVAQISVDLCFPVSRSWCEFIVRQHRSSTECMRTSKAHQAKDQRLIGLRLQGPSLNVAAPTPGSPTLCDFGAGTVVYATLAEPAAQARLVAEAPRTWRVEQRLHDNGRGDDHSDTWTVLQQSASSTGFTDETKAVEGWAHVMDRECCVALAMPEFGQNASDSMTVSGNGTIFVERRWDNVVAGKTPQKKSNGSSLCKEEAMTLLRCYYHFVPFPPQHSAATQPQAMLAPLQVRTV